MVAGSNLSWQGIKRKAVYTEGAGPVFKCTGQCTLPFFNPCKVHKFPHMGKGKFMHLIPLVFSLVYANSVSLFKCVRGTMGYHNAIFLSKSWRYSSR